MSKEELEKLEREKYVVERKLTAAMHNGLICVPMKDRDLTLSRQSTWERLSLRWSEKALPPTSAISTETLKPPTA